MEKESIRRIAHLIGELQFIRQDLAEIRRSLKCIERPAIENKYNLIHNRPVSKGPKQRS